MKLSKRKRFLLVFSILVSLFTVNCSLFAVTASANVAQGSTALEYSLGVPFDINFSVDQTELIGNTATLYGTIKDASCFWASSDGTVSVRYSEGVSWPYTSTGNPVTLWSLNNISVSPNAFSLQYVNAFPQGYISVYSFSSDYDYIFDVDSRWRDGLNPGITYANSVDVLTTAYVRYPVYDSSLEIKSISQRVLNIPYTTLSGWNYVIPVTQIKNAYDEAGLPYFLGEDGKSYIWLDSFELFFGSDSRYFSSIVLSSSSSLSSDDVYLYQDYAFENIIGSDVQMEVSFDNISWTDWLVSSVGSFMNFQIVPGLTLSGILGLLIGMSLFMVFLKVFAGG